MEINISSNKFDDDIIKRQSYQIIQDNSIQRDNNSKPNKINYNTQYNNFDANYKNNFDKDEDKNINLNININNYLSKRNININSNAPINNVNYTLKNHQKQKKIKKSYTDLNKGYLMRHLEKNRQNKFQNNKNYKNEKIKEKKETLQSKLLSRMSKKNENLNNNPDSEKIDFKTKKGKLNYNDINEKKKKEEEKRVPKILTFLETFKNMTFPLKLDKIIKKDIKYDKDNKNINTNKEKKNIIGKSNTLYNMNYKPLKKMLDINHRDNYNNRRKVENILEKDNDEDYIDYNRFTFRNSGDEKEDSPFRRKNIRDKKRMKNKNTNAPLYNEESSDSDINKNINIDAYQRKYNNNNKKFENHNRHKNIEINKYINKKRENEHEEFSPEFKQNYNSHINLIPQNNNNKNSTYLRKKTFKNKYSSPKPLHKNEIKNKNINMNYNISEKQLRKYNNDDFDSGNDSENSFRSLNPSKIYRKQILNNSFKIIDNLNYMNNDSYYYNNINSEKVNLEHNYYTINRPNKYKKVNNLLIDMNNETNAPYNGGQYNIQRNHLRMNRSPIDRKEKYNNNQLMNRSPYSSKDIYNKPYECSDFYDSQTEEEDKNKMNNNTNYSRFMRTFEQNDRKKWHNDDSYLSYDMDNMNKKYLNKNPLERDINTRFINKNNSMYIKQIVHYENKQNSFSNENSDSFSYKKNTDFYSINNNVYDFDAPKSINDFLDDKFSSNSSIYMSDSSRDNKFSINRDFKSDRLKNDFSNNQNYQTLSFREDEKPKMVYTKKLSTMYNFYQGTKKLFSNINNKISKFMKKDVNNKTKENKNIDDKYLINKVNLTPRNGIINDNYNLMFNKKFQAIKEKVIFKNKCFYQKFYNHFIKPPKIKNIGFYFSHQKIVKVNKIKKKINIPGTFLKYFKKGPIKANKIPLIKESYISKLYIIKKALIYKIEKLKIDLLKPENQVNIIIPKITNKNDVNYSNEKNNFSIFDKNGFNSENIKPLNIWNVSIINNKDSHDTSNKKYQYKKILSLKDDKLSLNSNLLPKNVLEHFKELNESIELINLDKNIKIKDKKDFNKDEIQKIVKRYVKPYKFNQNNKIPDNNSKNEINIDNQKWARNDFTKETEQAENYIKELNKKMNENSKHNNIIGILNILTMDNKDEVLNKTMTLITRNEENFILSDQEIIKNEYMLIKEIINKACMESRFVSLYANLCHELYIKLNNVSYNRENFKTILIEECENKFNELNIKENISKSKIISLDDEKIILIKKQFIGNIDFISELINDDFLEKELGFYYLEELNKIYNNNDNIEKIDKFKKNIALEATVNFISKFGKKIFLNKDINCINKLNKFINTNLKSILDNKDLSGFLKYKIINLIEKQKNKWHDSLFEKSILAKSKNNFCNNTSKRKRIRKRRNSNKSLKIMKQNTLSDKKVKNNIKGNKSLNSSTINNDSFISLKLNSSNSYSNVDEEIIKLIEEDIIKYKEFLNLNNIINKSDLNKRISIGNEFDWSSIEEILLANKINLAEIIICYIEVCIDKIIDSNQIFFANDYIKNIICYYSSDLTNKEKSNIHNKMINLFLNIRDICIDNNNMKQIMGYLMLILIENKLYFIKDLNNFIGLEKEIIITIAEVIKFTIISSEEKCKKYHNDFKQTKLFSDNNIFSETVTNTISHILK